MLSLVYFFVNVGFSYFLGQCLISFGYTFTKSVARSRITFFCFETMYASPAFGTTLCGDEYLVRLRMGHIAAQTEKSLFHRLTLADSRDPATLCPA